MVVVLLVVIMLVVCVIGLMFVLVRLKVVPVLVMLVHVGMSLLTLVPTATAYHGMGASELLEARVNADFLGKVVFGMAG